MRTHRKRLTPVLGCRHMNFKSYLLSHKGSTATVTMAIRKGVGVWYDVDLSGYLQHSVPLARERCLGGKGEVK